MLTCPFCDSDISRKKNFHNVWTEEYENKFGTICPICKKRIPPDIDIQKMIKNKKKLLENETLEIIKKKFFGDKK